MSPSVIVDVVFVLATAIFNTQGTEIVHSHAAVYQTRDECRQMEAVVQNLFKQQKKDDYQRFMTTCTPLEVVKVERE